MALITMAVYDTAENKRSDMTLRTLLCLSHTVDLNKHRVVIVDNASIDATKKIYESFPQFEVIHNEENVGTAAAVNQAWRLRLPGEHVVKMDNDVVIHQSGWADQLEEAISRDPQIGIIGLKRIDLMENPYRPEGDQFRSTLRMLPPHLGATWMIVEDVNHVMGTCQMFNSALLDKIGYLYQPRLYGFDDALAAVRCRVAGFKNCFLPHIRIDHIDPGDTPYQKWKEREAGLDMAEYYRLKNGYINGSIPVYYNPFAV